MDRKTGARCERGFALVGALWAVMVLSLAASSVVTTSLTEARLTRGRIKSAELSAAADAVVNIVLLRLLSLDRASTVPVDGTPFSVTFGDYIATVSLQDEAGKVDLNFADRSLLLRLIELTGAGAAIADTAADRILDWRDSGGGKHLLGAKLDDYRAAGFAYAPRNAPFESVEELRLVVGVHPGLFDTVALLLTVYSQKAWPDTASRDILSLLPEVGKLNNNSVAQARVAREGAPVIQTKTSAGSVFSIKVFLSERISPAMTTAVFRLTGNTRDPIWVYR